jgi:hypothetical protein
MTALEKNSSIVVLSMVHLRIREMMMMMMKKIVWKRRTLNHKQLHQ